MIPLFVTSKNRPTQLRLLLESLSRNCSQLFDVSVLHFSSEPCYKEGYEKVQSENLLENIEWAEERTKWPHTERASGVFTEQFYEFLNVNKGGHFALMVDDNVFFRKTSVSPDDITRLLDEETFSFSFRLGKNTSIQNHLDGQKQLPLDIEMETEDGFIKWDWHKYNNAFTDYAFPFSWDGVVYRTDDILDILDGSDLDNDDRIHPSWKRFPLPHRLESFMGTLFNARDGLFAKKRLLCAPPHSHVVGMDYNKVINVSNRGGHRFRADEKELCESYLRGYHIDYDSMNFQNVKSAHDEIPFKLTE